MDFVTLDVETANADPKSICQIGVAIFKDGELVDTWGTLINPHDEFDWMNIQIHGITSNDVKQAPTMVEVQNKLESYIGNAIVGTYTSFDKTAIEKNYGQTNFQWLDITKVVRRTWEEVSYTGYGLANVCKLNSIEIGKHHDAIEDAIAAGKVLVAALQAKKLTISDCEHLVKKGIVSLIASGSMVDSLGSENVIIDGGNPDGEWFGDVLCFTGEMSMPRIKASILASQAGFDVGKGVTKKTNYLIKGQQDLTKLNGKDISSKEEKALSLIKKGQDIIIISEDDFFRMISRG
ncbi:exonuclease domain-containing protein [Acinetobacter sichuanensis]|uniref:Exonuclease domain-containing protein n=1 Tax=Acinetobacter sichuanensis TaxID=2136183 RepID=A0A371YJ35_9GAMM|nr:exonuclease domain-containing protein [Acinetobacter sichuanensis]RFC81499.1 transposase [Acinetobacter sichuanensis]